MLRTLSPEARERAVMTGSARGAGAPAARRGLSRSIAPGPAAATRPRPPTATPHSRAILPIPRWAPPATGAPDPVMILMAYTIFISKHEAVTLCPHVGRPSSPAG